MNYSFKPFAEAGWAAFIAASLALLQVLVVLRPEEVTDWRMWVVPVAGAILRAAAGAAVAVLGARKLSEPS